MQYCVGSFQTAPSQSYSKGNMPVMLILFFFCLFYADKTVAFASTYKSFKHRVSLKPNEWNETWGVSIYILKRRIFLTDCVWWCFVFLLCSTSWLLKRAKKHHNSRLKFKGKGLRLAISKLTDTPNVGGWFFLPLSFAASFYDMSIPSE